MMSTQIRFQTIGLPLIALFALGGGATSQLSQSAHAQGFYFESWRGGYGSPWGGRYGGIGIGIGVQPSSPIFYGVRPSRIFPPLGYRGTLNDPRLSGYPRHYSYSQLYGDPQLYSYPQPTVPLGYRADRFDDGYRLYPQYRADPLYQREVNESLRRRSVRPLDGAPPVAAIEPSDGVPNRTDAASGKVTPADLPPLLRNAAQRLSLALSRRGEEGEIWAGYLAPAAIIAAIDEGTDARQLGTVLLNYEGVITNGGLRWVVRLDGFMETRHWLRQYIKASAGGPPVQQQQRQPVLDDPAIPPPPPSPSPSPTAEGTGRTPGQENADELLPAPSEGSL